MKSLDRKLLRDLVTTWGMLLAVASIIAIGIGSFIGMLSAARNLLEAKGQYYSTCRMADFWIDLKKAPVQEVERLARMRGISDIRPRIQFKVLCDLEGVDEPVGGIMISMPPDPAPVLNGLVMRSGSYFTRDRVNEIIVSEKFAAARGLEPGDTLAVIMNGRREELVIAGTAISAEFVYLTSPGSLVDDPKNYGLLYVKQAFAEDHFGFEGACNSVVGLLTPDVAGHGEHVIAELARRLEPYGVFVAVPRAQQFSHMTMAAELTSLQTMAYIFPSFFLLVAALVLNVLMMRLVEQQRTVIGTLKALGYANRELFIHYLKFSAAAGVAGGLIGAGIGYGLAEGMTTMYTAFFSFPRLVNRFYPALVVEGLAVSVAVCLAGALNGARRVMRLQPAEAMRPAAPRAGGAILLERWRVLWRRLDIQWQMVLRDLARRKGRAAVSVFSAAMGAAIVVLAFGFVDSMDTMIALQFDKVLRSDYHLTFSSDTDAAVLDELRRLPGVTAMEPVFHVACTFTRGHREKRGGVTGIEPGARLTVPRDAAGRPVPLPQAGLLMADRLLEQLGAEVGDVLTLTPVRGDRTPIAAPVAASFPSTMGLVVYADLHWLNRIVGESAAASEARVLALQNRAERRTFMRAIKDMPQLETVTDIREQKQALVAQFNGAMRGAAVIMIGFAAVIFFGAILNATLISMSERRREIATFGALGYHEGEIARLFLRENMVTNMAGTLVGLPLGWFMLLGTMTEYQTDAYSFPAALRPASLVYTVVLAVLFVVTTQLAVYRSIGRLNKVEALSLNE